MLWIIDESFFCLFWSMSTIKSEWFYSKLWFKVQSCEIFSQLWYWTMRKSLAGLIKLIQFVQLGCKLNPPNVTQELFGSQFILLVVWNHSFGLIFSRHFISSTYNEHVCTNCSTEVSTRTKQESETMVELVSPEILRYLVVCLAILAISWQWTFFYSTLAFSSHFVVASCDLRFLLSIFLSLFSLFPTWRMWFVLPTNL